MALMERVTTLLRANLNDLIDKAEDPEKMLKQLVLDMENQLLQVKTQVAIAIADQHLLEKKTAEHETAAATLEEQSRACCRQGPRRHGAGSARAIAVSCADGQEFSRAAGRSAQRSRRLCAALFSSCSRSSPKPVRTVICSWRSTDGLATVGRSQQAHAAARTEKSAASIDRYKSRISVQQAANQATRELTAGDSLEDRFAMLERDQQVEALLEELKQQKALPA